MGRVDGEEDTSVDLVSALQLVARTHGVLVSTVSDQNGGTGTGGSTGDGRVESALLLTAGLGRVESVAGSTGSDVGSDDGDGTEPKGLGGCSCKRHGMKRNGVRVCGIMTGTLDCT